jgi:hypothetical protein
MASFSTFALALTYGKKPDLLAAVERTTCPMQFFLPAVMGPAMIFLMNSALVFVTSLLSFVITHVHRLQKVHLCGMWHVMTCEALACVVSRRSNARMTFGWNLLRASHPF